MKKQELPSGSALTGLPLTLAELTGLPVLSVVLNTDANPHAWQKRLVVTEEGSRRHQWFCTTDSDWGETSEQMLDEWGALVLLWLPSMADVTRTLAEAE